MLTARVTFHDVLDGEAFVRATIRNAGLSLQRDETEELVAEGLLILTRLASAYEPRRAGHTADGRFSGFAAKYLPKKLGDAWHRLHPEHKLVTGPDGRRTWVYHRPAVSLDALRQANQETGSTWEATCRDVTSFGPVPRTDRAAA